MDTNASLIPPVTLSAFIPASPSFIKAKELINPNTVPNSPNNGATVTAVSYTHLTLPTT